ncbi:MAG TPA: TetR/AcrR family transcriptional regulator [Ktedonobacterales bacterium]
MSQENTLRRTPQQSRGQRRIAAILDAAEQLFGEIGYDATTTNAIAARAQTAIGSLYQFFPNKEAILRELVARFLVELRASLDASLAEVGALPDLTLERAIDYVLDPLIALYASRAGILRVFLGQHGRADRVGAPRVISDEVVTRLQALLALREPQLAPETQRLYAEVVVAAVRALLPLTIAPDGTPRADMIAELKRLVRAYLTACGTNQL